MSSAAEPDEGMEESIAIKEQYQKFIGRKVTFILILIPILFVLAGLAASLGSANISMWDAYSAFLHRFFPDYFASSRLAEICVWKLRLLRALVSVLRGV
jgi:iron complex transport system permease protein